MLSGYYSFLQPTINPLFKTRPWQNSLLKWVGATTDYSIYLKEYWTKKLGNVDMWEKALQDGIFTPTTTGTTTAPAFKGNTTDAITRINTNKKVEKQN